MFGYISKTVFYSLINVVDIIQLSSNKSFSWSTYKVSWVYRLYQNSHILSSLLRPYPNVGCIIFRQSSRGDKPFNLLTSDAAALTEMHHIRSITDTVIRYHSNPVCHWSSVSTLHHLNHVINIFCKPSLHCLCPSSSSSTSWGFSSL